jgi:hypothetical protein
MRIVRRHSRVACFAGAMALLVQISPALASDHDQRPVEITFTKWIVTAPPPPAPQPPFGLLEGFAGEGLVGSFVGEVLWRQASLNGHVVGLEAMYEVVDGDRSFTALIRGGQNAAGAAHFDGVILAGWRAGRARAGRVSAASRNCRGAQLRGRPREQDVLRGNHLRRAHRRELRVPQARTRAPNVGRVWLSGAEGPRAGPGLRSVLSQRTLTVPDSSARRSSCSAVDRTRSSCRQATHRSSESRNRF